LEREAVARGIAECILETTQTALPFYQALGYVKSPKTYVLPLTGSTATVLTIRLRAPKAAS
jgi:hypothetical protein